MNIAGKLALAALAAAAMVESVPAQASLITQTYDFSASGFGSGAPVDPVSGSVTITFDPTVSVSNVTTGIALNSLNLSLDSPIAFSFLSGTSRLFIGGLADLIAPITGAEDDFILQVSAPGSATLGFLDLEYAQGTGQLFTSLDGTVSLGTPPAQSVPEPATLALFGTSLLGLAWQRRRRDA